MRGRISYELTPFFMLAIIQTVGKPLVQAERRVLEDGSGLERELPLGMLRLADPTLTGLVEVDAVAAAGRAGDAIRPAPGHKVGQAVLRTGEVLDGFEQRARVVHNPKDTL